MPDSAAVRFFAGDLSLSSTAANKDKLNNA
jgi:hypothetical protein